MTQFRPGGFNILPDVVKNLLIVNGLMFFATIVLEDVGGINLVDLFGFHYWGSDKFKIFQVVTHLFMHGSFMHLFSNMFALWMFGSILENLWGPKRFLIYYMITGLGAATLHAIVTFYDIFQFQNDIAFFAETPSFDLLTKMIKDHVPIQYLSSFRELASTWSHSPDSDFLVANAVQLFNQLLQIKMDIPTVGASGAVFGVLLAFGMMFPNSYIYLFFMLPIKAKYFVMLYGAFELFSGLQNNPADNVAHYAHLGGMIFGYFLIKSWNKNNRRDFF